MNVTKFILLFSLLENQLFFAALKQLLQVPSDLKADTTCPTRIDIFNLTLTKLANPNQWRQIKAIKVRVGCVMNLPSWGEKKANGTVPFQG